MVDPTTLPPASIIIAYWLGGAFLMAAKRLSEYREIVASHGRDVLVRYRASFRGYDELESHGVLLSLRFAQLDGACGFYRQVPIEYILVLPAIALLFGQYLALSMRPASTAQKPELLFQERGLLALVVVIVALVAVCTIVNIPALEPLTAQHYIQIQ